MKNGTISTNTVTLLTHKCVFGDWSVDSASKCNSIGKAVRSCTLCQKKEYKEIPLVEHTFGKWRTTVNPTCTEGGEMIRSCSVCGAEETKTIDALGHDYSDRWTVDEEADCVNDGSKSHHCTRCKAKKDITSIPATGHKYVETVVEPSYSNRGYTLYECSVCGYSYKDNYEEQLIVPAVTGFASGSQTKSSAVLGWDKVSDADGYAVELYTGGKWNEVFRTSDSSVTSCTVGSLKADSTYSLRIRAFKDTDDGTVYSDYTRLAVKTKLANVAGLKAQGVTATAVKLDWARNAGATGYIIEQYKGGKWTQIAVTKNNYTLTFTVKGLAECTPYSFRVKAYKNDGGKTNYSDYVTVKASTLLGTVKNAKVTSTTGTWITLGWDRNTGATGYVLEQYKGGRWTEIAVTKNNTTLKFTVKGLRNDTTYSFRIKAYKTVGDTTTYGSYVRVVGTTDIPNVAKFTGSAVSASAVKLDWSKNDKATGYVIEQYKGGRWTEIKAVDNDITEITVEGLAKGTAYSFRIKSFRKTGSTTEFSEYTAIKAATLLDGVSDFKVASTTGSWITLEWAKNDKATGYSIEQYKGGKWTVIATTKNNTTLKFTVKGLKNDTTYSFRIRAYKTSGSVTAYSDYVRIAGKTRIPNVAKFTGSAVSASAVKLDWSKNDKATAYVIEQYKGGKWTVLATTKNNTTLKFTVKGLAEGTTYSFRIKSFRKTGGTTEFSEYASVKVNTAE